MTKVAVIGCSHSDLNLQEYNNPPTLPPKKGNAFHSWIVHAAESNPQVHFDCYAKAGEGAIYFDFCLKNIVNQDYDMCIVQLTTDRRWMFPLNYKLDQTDTWTTHKVTKNLNAFLFQPEHINVCGNVSDIKSKTRNYDKQSFVKNFLPTNNLSETYSKLFLESLETVYAKCFKNFIYFTMWNDDHYANNIGHEKTGFDFLTQKYGQKYFKKNFVTTDYHLNYEGAKIFYEDYLKPKIKY